MFGEGSSRFEAQTSEQVAGFLDDFDEGAAPVALVAASNEEFSLLSAARDELSRRGISFERRVLNPAANPLQTTHWAENATLRGVRVVIAAAGECVTLPSAIATWTDVPVIAVPLSDKAFNGLDTLLSVTSTAKGTPLATMPVDGSRTAAIFASRILTALPMAPQDGE
jgi:5-(carboxyamino)imidazole ribonucleotide mutase